MKKIIGRCVPLLYGILILFNNGFLALAETPTAASDTYNNGKALLFIYKAIKLYDTGIFPLLLFALLVCISFSYNKERNLEFFKNGLKILIIVSLILNCFVLILHTVSWFIKQYDGRNYI